MTQALYARMNKKKKKDSQSERKPGIKDQIKDVSIRFLA
jgi:hypothetical protein